MIQPTDSEVALEKWELCAKNGILLAEAPNAFSLVLKLENVMLEKRGDIDSMHIRKYPNSKNLDQYYVRSCSEFLIGHVIECAHWINACIVDIRQLGNRIAILEAQLNQQPKITDDIRFYPEV